MNLNNNLFVKTKIHSDSVFRIVLDNPKRHNALSQEMMTSIQKALDSTIDNKKIRVIIISA